MKGCAMSQIVLDAEAGQVSAELARRGIPSYARVHALVEVTLDGEPPMAAIAQAGKARLAGRGTRTLLRRRPD